MSSAHSMNARKCVHAQKPYSFQAFAHESSKVGGREKKRDRKDRGQEADGKKGNQKKKKINKKFKISEKLKQGLPRHS